MAYCFDDLGDYAVTPMLVSPCGSEKCCQPPPLCYPCLPRCPKGQVVYYCEKPQSIQRKSSKNCDSCCHETPKAESYCKRRCLSPSREDCCPSCNNPCKPIKTKYVIPCYRYEDGRIVQKLPASAFKRNGMQDQEHSKLLGTANFLKRCPRDVAIECEVSPVPLKVRDPIKVPEYNNPMECCSLKKEPIEVSLEDVLYD
ncbi:uncharacterized protein [Maniola hyperantus]|uniref:uncharacterized protein isoform X2 n=1 Tax=Aphantopus hyperantus TaxID=2795564 RepID=UPI0037499815